MTSYGPALVAAAPGPRGNVRMRRRAYLLTWVLPALAALPVRLFADGEGAAQFLKIGAGARARAMGEAFVGLAAGPSAIYWNPAGVVQARSLEAMMMHNFWLLDMSCQFAGITVPTKAGTFGASFLFSYSGEFDRYENEVKTGSYNSYDVRLAVSHARPLTKSVAFGVTLGAIQQKIADASAYAPMADLGVLIKVPRVEGLKTGVTVRNLGAGLKFIDEVSPLPLVAAAGLSYTYRFLTAVADISRYADSETRGNFGGEVSIRELLFLRGGYTTANSYSFGAGISHWKLSANYAFTPHKYLNPTHCVDVVLRW